MELEKYVDQEDKNKAVIMHILSIFAGIISPLIFYFVISGNTNTSDFLKKEIKNDLNFQITLAIAYLVCSVLMFLLIGFILLPILWVFSLVMEILATLKAKDGINYDFPISLKLIN